MGTILLFAFFLSFVCQIDAMRNSVPDEKYVNTCPAPTYHVWTSNKETKGRSKNNTYMEFTAYPNKKLMKTSAKIATYNFTDVRQCIHNCSMTASCVSFNAFSTQAEDGVELLTCALFSTQDGFFLQKHGTTFYSRYAPLCPGYCEELHYLKVCAHCDCVSLCSTNITHYCDCTPQIKTPQKDCNGAVRIYGEFPLSALYYIDTARYTLKAMCQLYKYNVVEILWVTLYRRLSTNTDEFERSREEYRVGFNKPYDDNYFIGYDKIAALTETDIKMTLGVIVVKEYRTIYIEYDEFKMVEVDAKNLVYDVKYKSFRSNDCAFPNLPSKGSYSRCPQFDLLNNCNKKMLFGKWENGIKGLTFVLRPQQFNKPIKGKKREIRSLHVFGRNFKGHEETCIIVIFSIKGQVNNLVILRVFKWIDGWSNIFELNYKNKQFNLIRGKNVYSRLNFNFKAGTKYKLRFRTRINQRYSSKLDISFGIFSKLVPTFYVARSKFNMSGKLLIETGYEHFDPFFLNGVYFNGKDIF